MNDQTFRVGVLADILSAADELADVAARPDYAQNALRSSRLAFAGGEMAGEAFARPTRRDASFTAMEEQGRGAPVARLPHPEAIGLEYVSQTAELETRLIGIFADPESEFAKAFPEACDWRLKDSERVDFPEVAEAVTKFRRRRSYQRWEDANPESAPARLRNWKAANPDKVAAHKRNWRSKNPDKVAAQKERAAMRAYAKPFIAIDFEGQDYPGEDVPYNKAAWPKHRIFLGGAGGWRRLCDPVELAKVEDEEHRRALLHSGETVPFEWLGDASKRPLTTRETFDWLLSLPSKFGNATFVMFAFNYDVTQILMDLARPVAWEVAKRETFPDREKGEAKGRPIGEAPTFWREYAIKYIKSKVFELWRLRDPDKPWRTVIGKDGLPVIDERTGRERRELDASEHIVIYDAFGFYQQAFVEVCKSLVGNDYMTEGELETIRQQKENRPDFDRTDFETIKQYCGLELIGLSKALTVLRDGFDRMGLRLHAWSGAGSAASASFRKEKVHKDHFPADITTDAANIPPWQDAAHHAYFGGNIQLMKQGYVPRENVSCGAEGEFIPKLWGYDVVSAYPSACVELPSMRDGTWSHVERPLALEVHGLDAIKAAVAGSSMLSMFLVRWTFPIAPKPSYDRKARRHETTRPFPFFPLPYRRPNGAILFPSAGKTWIMRDELLGALKWIETFFPDAKTRKQIVCFLIHEQWLFHPANDEKPFAFVRDLYAMRAKTTKADTLNKAIKLVINSIYGKTAQSIGGSNGKPPITACPYYAAAITANCRMRLMFAALHAPHEIVMFATDGIVSTRPLNGLARVVDTDNEKRKPDLGDWELGRSYGGCFLQSGVYFIFAKKGDIASKTRGMKLGDAFKLSGGKREFLLERVIPQWRKPYDPNDPSTFPRLDIETREFVTISSAVSSYERFKVRGRWAITTRGCDIHTIGVKRTLLGEDGAGGSFFEPFYLSQEARAELSDDTANEHALLIGCSADEVRAMYATGEAFRCQNVVPSLPALNPTPSVLSAPRMPDWIDEETGESKEHDLELAEIETAESAGDCE